MIHVKNPKHRRRHHGNHWATHFDNAINDLMGGSLSDFVSKSLVQSQPLVNIIKNESDFVLEIAVPGFSKKDIDIHVKEDKLTIAAIEEEVKDGSEKTEPNFTKREFHYDGFKRSFTLPENIDLENIKANFTNGILKITLPLKEKVDTSRNIKIS